MASLGWVDAERLRSMYSEMMGVHKLGNYSYLPHVTALWIVYYLDLWYRTVVRGIDVDQFPMATPQQVTH
jgi:hypothetical protein